MAKIEKTLELNITHELLSLTDSFWWFLQPISLKRYWRPNWRFPLIQPPKSFATGLHINLEGKSGGGYDVCINSPSNFQGGNPRLLFMQFKAGEEKLFHPDSQSIFHGTPSKPNIHVEFDINRNKNRNQHRLLQELAAKAGQKDAVVYVFPRIVNNDQLEKNIGQLIRKTSFISISEIDKKASENNVTIDDGNAHKFRTCYTDYSRNEVNYYYYYFGEQLLPGGMLGEIFSIRLWRALMTYKEVLSQDFSISKFHIIDAMIRHILILGQYFSISYKEVFERLVGYRDFHRILIDFESYEQSEKLYDIKEEASLHDKKMFNDIFKSLSPYFVWIGSIRTFDKNSDIPTPSSNYTIELENNGFRYEIDEQKQGFEEEDINDIYYQLL